MFEIKKEDKTQQLSQSIDYFCEEALRSISEEVARKARRRVPRNTGAMARAISIDPVRKGGDPSEGDDTNDWVAGVFVDHEAAAAVEFGSARRGEPFVNPPADWPQEAPPEKQANEPYFNAWYQKNIDIPKHGGRYKGKHPGVRPRPFLRPSISEVCFRDGVADKFFQEAFENAYRKARSTSEGGTVSS